MLLAIGVGYLAGPAASSERVIYAFRGEADGAVPRAPLIMDSSGNLYGTTSLGGGSNQCDGGCGTIFRIEFGGGETLLHAFAGSDGTFPSSNLIADGTGNLYGTTELGGASGHGTLFELAADGTESVVYSFLGGSNGSEPDGNLTIDANGNFYGTTVYGGNTAGSDCVNSGCGTVFKVAPDGTQTVLYAFQGGTDGFQPYGGVILDANGNLYGTTALGGNGNNCGSGGAGCGTVFKIAQDGTETVLYSFQGGNDGAIPAAALIADNGGNLYGTTAGGGGCAASGSCGTVFKLAPNGIETVLHAFQAGSDGNLPESGLVMDNNNNLYGTTLYGGVSDCSSHGCGIVFKVTANGRETVLFAFKNGGRFPEAGLLAGPHGLLYGTTTEGGVDKVGVVYRVKKRRKE